MGMKEDLEVTNNTSAEKIFGRFPLMKYEEEYTKSIENPRFFSKFTGLLDWFSLPEETDSHPEETDLLPAEINIKEEEGFVFREFFNGQLNACYNCLDRHPESSELLLFESNLGNLIAFNQQLLMERVQQYSHELIKYLKLYDVKEVERSDFVVTIFMPMCPDTFCIILACARLGLPHSVVFAGYSSTSLIKRIKDAKSRLIIGTDYYKRGEKTIEFKGIFEELKDKISRKELSLLIVTEKKRMEFEKQARNIYAHETKEYENLNSLENIYAADEVDYFKGEKILKKNYIDCYPVKANHPLFYLYTSGSTGDPKGIVHTTANYLIYAMISLKQNFYNSEISTYNCLYTPLKIKEINYKKPFFCTADIGWITGHTYSLYGPLCFGLTTLISTGIPNYPPNKIYTTLLKSKTEIFYTAPTLIRSLKEIYNPNNLINLPSLRLIGSVGEPLNSDAKIWVSEYLKADVIDTYWQTETGGHLLSGVEGCKPMYGILPKILRSISDSEDHLLGTEGISEYSIHSLNSFVSDSVDSVDSDFKSSADEKALKEEEIKKEIKEEIKKEIKEEIKKEIKEEIKKEVKEKIIRGNREITETTIKGSVCFKNSWPGLAKTIIGDHKKYLKTYFGLHPGFYFTGDQGFVVHDFLSENLDSENLDSEKILKKELSLEKIKDCVCFKSVLEALKNKTKKIKIHNCFHYSFVITGRTDDVLNVSGHRISTREVEDAVTSLEEISECAVVSNLDPLTGESIVLFLVLKGSCVFKETEGLKKLVTEKLRKSIGSHVKPSEIYLISKLPTTRTGKIMRRTLRAIVRKEEIGDVSTCINREVLDEAKFTVDSFNFL